MQSANNKEIRRDILRITVIIIRNGIGDLSSNPG